MHRAAVQETTKEINGPSVAAVGLVVPINLRLYRKVTRFVAMAAAAVVWCDDFSTLQLGLVTSCCCAVLLCLLALAICLRYTTRDYSRVKDPSLRRAMTCTFSAML